MDIVPDDAEYHLRLSSDGWIIMDCGRCNKPVMAATHMDIHDWVWKAERHYKTCRPLAEEYSCPRCVAP